MPRIQVKLRPLADGKILTAWEDKQSGYIRAVFYKRIDLRRRKRFLPVNNGWFCDRIGLSSAKYYTMYRPSADGYTLESRANLIAVK